MTTKANIDTTPRQLSDADMEAVQTLLRHAERSEAGGPMVTHRAIDKLVELEARRRGELTPGMRFKQWREGIRDLAGDPIAARYWDEANNELRELFIGCREQRDIQPGTVHTNAVMTQLSVQYANEAYIGEQLMPVVTVSKESDTFYTYGQQDRMEDNLDDEMPINGEANEIHETRGTDTYTCKAYGLADWVSVRTINNQDAPLDEMLDAQQAPIELLAFKRECRIAAVVGAGSSYGANTSALSAGVRWDISSGDPIKNIQDADAARWVGAGNGNVYQFSDLSVFQVLSRHPDILALFQYNGSSPGLATPQMIANFFGHDGYLIGRARKQTNKEGAAASYSRIWPVVWGLVRVSAGMSLRNAAFGYTIRCGAPISNVEFYPQRGHGGSYKAQSSYLETHKVVAPLTSYLYTTPIG